MDAGSGSTRSATLIVAWEHASSTVFQAANTDSRQDRRSESSTFVCLDNFNSVSENIGLDLPPKGRLSTAAAKPNGVDRLHPMSRKISKESRRLKATPSITARVKCARRVTRGQSDKRRPGVRVEMRRSLAHKVGQPNRTVGAGMERPHASRPNSSKTLPPPRLSRNHFKLCPAPRVTPVMCQRPGIAWQSVCTRPLRVERLACGETKTTPDVPIVTLTVPGARCPYP